MALTASRLPPFEQQARALAEVWLTAMADPSLLARQAEEILASSAAQDRPKLAALSLALDATVTVYVRSDHPGAMARVAALFDAVRAVGWERATRLAEAALSRAQRYHPEPLFSGPPPVLAHGDADDDPRPPAERVWTDCALHRRACETKLLVRFPETRDESREQCSSIFG